MSNSVDSPGNGYLNLGVFMANTIRGFTISTYPASTYPTVHDDKLWEYQLDYAAYADTMGLDVLVPVSRWIGMGGKTDFQGGMLECYTLMAALAARTEQIHLFVTTLTHLWHPITVAKMGATIDHISHGRFGLNMISGWVQHEFEMWTKPMPPEIRHDYNREWFDVVRGLWTEPSYHFNYPGTYFQIDHGYLEPKPVQKPYPLILKAGVSEGSIDFVANECDWFLTGAFGVAQGRDQLGGLAARAGRRLRILTYAYVLCRDTEEEAQRVLEGIREDIDEEAVTTFTSARVGGVPAAALRRDARAAGIGLGGQILVGNPEQVADGLRAMQAEGADGVLLCFNDFVEDLQRFDEQVYPLLKQMGLRPARGPVRLKRATEGALPSTRVTG